MFLRNIPRPQPLPPAPAGSGPGERRPWEGQGVRLKEKEAKTAQEHGAGSTQATSVLTTSPTRPEPLGGKPAEQLSVRPWALLRPALGLPSRVPTPDSPLMGCVPGTWYSNLSYGPGKQASR